MHNSLFECAYIIKKLQTITILSYLLLVHVPPPLCYAFVRMLVAGCDQWLICKHTFALNEVSFHLYGIWDVLKYK
jgi:hypothetical protein